MEYSIEKISFPSVNGIDDVAAWIYKPQTAADEKPAGVIQIVHGMCEYIGRYDRFMRYLAEKGFAVCGNDHTGHGDSSKSQDYGYFGREKGYVNLVEDVHRMTSVMKERYPDIPYFIFGHSMGSFVTRLYIEKYAYELTGAVICGTGGPNPLAAAGIAVCNAVAFARGAKYRSRMIDNMAFGAYNKRMQPQRTEKDWLTRDNEIVDRYLNDEKCMFLFTAAGYRDLFTLSRLANRKQWYESLDRNLPMLLVSGEMDPVGDYGKGVRKVFENLKVCGISDVEMKLYPDDRHEILNELDYEAVYSDIYGWIEKHL